MGDHLLIGALATLSCLGAGVISGCNTPRAGEQKQLLNMSGDTWQSSVTRIIICGELANPNWDKQCGFKFLSSSHIMYYIAIAFFWKNVHIIKFKLGLCQDFKPPNEEKCGTRPGWKSTLKNTAETFQKWSAYDTQTIFSMALIWWHSWMQPMNDAIGWVLAPFTSLCSTRHNNRWRA